MASSSSLALSGKVIIITGASSGIGAAVAFAAVEAGANIVLAARRLERLEQEKTSLESKIASSNLPGKVLIAKLDVTLSSDWEALIADTVKAFGKIDVLINNAGVMLLSKVLNLKVDEWMSMVDINIKGVFLGTAAILPLFKSQNSGFVLNISSDADRKVFTGSAVYSATKAAITRFSEGVRMELAADGIKVNVSTISPGAVMTELSSHITDTDITDGWSKSKPFEMMQAKDIADIVIFVLSREGRVNIDNLLVKPYEQWF